MGMALERVPLISWDIFIHQLLKPIISLMIRSVDCDPIQISSGICIRIIDLAGMEPKELPASSSALSGANGSIYPKVS
ncbi:hypothetical protein DSO57_1019094 [Entomophthora muscae]|uniref:Uncharacterized protein n=1 Tax=Entomophthora muscae TaxID=34485 RepID=A0ACC2TG23_9FUNG|nr:hypothetical protein DSO57_1019094 [Entomophthora muscae]